MIALLFRVSGVLKFAPRVPKIDQDHWFSKGLLVPGCRDLYVVMIKK